MLCSHETIKTPLPSSQLVENKPPSVTILLCITIIHQQTKPYIQSSTNTIIIIIRQNNFTDRKETQCKRKINEETSRRRYRQLINCNHDYYSKTITVHNTGFISIIVSISIDLPGPARAGIIACSNRRSILYDVVTINTSPKETER